MAGGYSTGWHNDRAFSLLQKFSWAVSLQKNWENPSTSNKRKESGGVGLRGRAASKHLMDIGHRGKGKEKQPGDTWTKQAQGRLAANEFSNVNNYVGVSGEKGSSGTGTRGPSRMRLPSSTPLFLSVQICVL